MGETPKTALPSQDRNGALTVVQLNSPRVAPEASLNDALFLSEGHSGSYKDLCEIPEASQEAKRYHIVPDLSYHFI
ncbi:hypothetical protein [Moorena sp. SIO4G3]|uniref:hypothetical protein n=1 Tax=Moorena sp. SIO4G3 TaxID=2607821 RepID=UPI00142A5E28|nr:hypothetical protein [Moorena sp. SIO4G3]NEO74852.1 hypothetical protein [Moorena sp. SIO4G3]